MAIYEILHLVLVCSINIILDFCSTSVPIANDIDITFLSMKWLQDTVNYEYFHCIRVGTSLMEIT